MSDATYARPYAKAVFEEARASNQLKEWSDALERLCAVLADKKGYALLKNPTSTSDQQLELLSIGLEKNQIYEMVISFAKLLIEYKRVLLLPEINKQYTIARQEYEKLGVVNVRSFNDLSLNEIQVLSEKLSTRFERKISLDVIVDKSLLGGMIIQSGDWILDGSVKSQLGQLANQIIE